jgi:polyhydroxyalkanoate synthesis regulator phasin
MMRKILEDLLHAGLGLGMYTKENIGKIFNELKAKGEVYEKDREYFITKTLEKLEKKGKEVAGKVKETLEPAGKKIDELSKKIDALVKELEEMKKKPG